MNSRLWANTHMRLASEFQQFGPTIPRIDPFPLAKIQICQLSTLTQSWTILNCQKQTCDMNSRVNADPSFTYPLGSFVYKWLNKNGSKIVFCLLGHWDISIYLLGAFGACATSANSNAIRHLKFIKIQNILTFSADVDGLTSSKWKNATPEKDFQTNSAKLCAYSSRLIQSSRPTIRCCVHPFIWLRLAINVSPENVLHSKRVHFSSDLTSNKLAKTNQNIRMRITQLDSRLLHAHTSGHIVYKYNCNNKSLWNLALVYPCFRTFNAQTLNGSTI